MYFGLKGAAMAALTAAVLATSACSNSGTIASSASHPSATGTSAATATSTPDSSPTTDASAAPSGGASGGPLTTGQITKALLTDKDDPGYTFNAADDGISITTEQDRVTGGTDCQAYMDAQEALYTKYATNAEVDRQLNKSATSHSIQDTIMALPTVDTAKSVVSDLTTSLKTCKTLSVSNPNTGGGITMKFDTIPQLTKDGQAGYIDYLTSDTGTALMAAEVVQVGTAVSLVDLIGPMTSDTATLQQMGATLAHLSDIQVGRLKTLQGLS